MGNLQDSLASFIDAVRGLRVVVVGETLHDVFVHGRPLSTPKSYPFIVAEATGTDEYLGGAYPVARDLANFVRSVTLVTNDVSALTSEYENLLIRGVRDTRITKTRHVAGTQTLYFSCEWPTDEEWTLHHPTFQEILTDALAEADVVIVFDYGHGLVSAEAAALISKRASFLAINCQANGGRHPFHQISRYPSFHLVALNEYEALLNSGQQSVDSHATLARSIRTQTQAKYCIVTDAERGAWICTGNRVVHQRSLCATIVDTIGCGDAMLGFAAAATVVGYDAKEVLYYSSLAAAAKARMRVHERPITPKALEDVEAAVSL